VIWVDGRVITSNMDEMMVHDLANQSSTRLRSHSMIYRQLTRCGLGHVAYWAADAQSNGYIEIADISSGATGNLTSGPIDSFPACTPDGSTLIFLHCKQGENQCGLMRKSLKTGESSVLTQVSLTTELGPNPVISPDGATVLVRRPLEPNDPYVWAEIVPLAAGVPRKLRMPVAINDVAAWAWSQDGKAILFVQNKNGVGNIWSMPLDGEPLKKVTAFESDLIPAFDVAPDGRLAMSRGVWVADVVHIRNVR